MADLKTDYKDDVLDTSQNINRTFNIKDSSGNILYQDCQIEETTVFETEGDEMNAQVINNTNTEVNNLSNNKVSGFADATYSAVTGLAYDGVGKKLGLKVGADTVIPFSALPNGTLTIRGTLSMNITSSAGGSGNPTSDFTAVIRVNNGVATLSSITGNSIAKTAVWHSSTNWSYGSCNFSITSVSWTSS